MRAAKALHLLGSLSEDELDVDGGGGLSEEVSVGWFSATSSSWLVGWDVGCLW